jgi:predicted DNA-binding protein (MmcQ/YjbR family)
MTLKNLQAICRQFDNVTEDIKWGKDYCFSVGGKIFLVVVPDTVLVAASFKVADELFEEMTERAGCIPAPYAARHKWVLVDNISRLKKQEWEYYIAMSCQLLAAKLPKKKNEKVFRNSAFSFTIRLHTTRYNRQKENL